MLNETTTHERTSLEAHVDLCAVRYSQLDDRLSKVETKVDLLNDSIHAAKLSMTKVIITGVVAIVVALVGAVATIISSMPV